MGGRVRRTEAFLGVVATMIVATCAAGASDLRLSLVSAPAQPEAGRPVSIVVAATRGGKPGEGARVVVWIERGRARRSFPTRAERKGRYRAQVVFPSAGRWSLGARSDGAKVRFRSVQVLRAATPLTFGWPTSIDLESNRSLLRLATPFPTPLRQPGSAFSTECARPTVPERLETAPSISQRRWYSPMTR